MLAGILLFELRYAMRRMTFVAAALLMLAMGFVLGVTGYGPQDGFVNGAYPVALSAAMLSLMSVLAATVICGPALLRDLEHQMAELVYATAVTRLQYLGGRFLGSFLALSLAYAIGLMGLGIGSLFCQVDPARIAPFSVGPTLRAFLFLGWPTLLTVAALIFGAAALTRSTAATYVTGVAIYMLYFVASLFTNSPVMAGAGTQSVQTRQLSALADPFGLSALFAVTHQWTAVQRDAWILSLEGSLLLNRLLWLGLTGGLLALIYVTFAFRVVPRGRRHSESQTESPAVVLAYRPVPVAEAGFAWPVFRSMLRLETRWLLRSWSFLALLVLSVGNFLIEMGQSIRSTEFRTALWPTTPLLAREMGSSLSLFGLLALVYLTAEVVWRARSARIAEVVDATPVPTAVQVAAKIGALSAMVFALIGASILGAIVFQLVFGHIPDHLGVYLGLFWFTGWPLVLFAVLAVLLQTVSPNRHVGLLATLAAGVFWHLGESGLEHPLLRYAMPLEVPYSVLTGYSPAAQSFAWFMAYWTLIALLLTLATIGLWRRGTEVPLRARLRAVPRRLGPQGRRLAGASAVATLLLGGWILRQTNVLNEYRTESQMEVWKADYERAFQHLKDQPVPSFVRLEGQLELFPSERSARFQGKMRLENRTDQPIRTVWVSTRRDLAASWIRLAGHAPTEADSRFSMHGFTLDPPLAPAASADLDFEARLQRQGASADPQVDVVSNGSFLVSSSLFPGIGYRRGYELTDALARRRQGLPEREVIQEVYDEIAPAAEDDSIQFDIEVSTEADQTPIAPGALVRSWTSPGRNHARFQSRGPAQPFLVFSSGRYAVRGTHHQGIEISVLYHPDHPWNIDVFLQAAQQSLDLFSSQFGPYPYPELRIVELPSYVLPAAAFAMPGVIFYAEQRGFQMDRRNPDQIDILTKRVAHEVAHQWWGHQVMPRTGPGATTLVETLARDSELLALQQKYGPESVLPVVEIELQRYLNGRASNVEVPLAQARSQPWLYYSKGAIVMRAMRDLLGDAVVNGVLRDLVTLARTRKPVCTDLVQAFLKVTPEAQHPLIDQWWNDIVLYDLQIQSATAQHQPDGRYRVIVVILASKVQVRDGHESPLPFDETLPLAVYGSDGKSADTSQVLRLARQPLTASSEVTWLVDQKPGAVMIDPALTRLDRNRFDNWLDVTVQE